MTRGRAWATALTAGAVALILTLVFGNGTIASKFGGWASGNSFSVSLIRLVAEPRWNVSVPDTARHQVANPSLFLVAEWTIVVLFVLLVLFLVRGLMRSLHPRRSGFGTFLGTWGSTAIAGALAFLVGNIIEWYAVNDHLTPGASLNDRLFQYTGVGAFYGFAVGWFIGLIALIPAKAGLVLDEEDGESAFGVLPPLGGGPGEPPLDRPGGPRVPGARPDELGNGGGYLGGAPGPRAEPLPRPEGPPHTGPDLPPPAPPRPSPFGPPFGAPPSAPPPGPPAPPPRPGGPYQGPGGPFGR